MRGDVGNWTVVFQLNFCARWTGKCPEIPHFLNPQNVICHYPNTRRTDNKDQNRSLQSDDHFADWVSILQLQGQRCITRSSRWSRDPISQQIYIGRFDACNSTRSDLLSISLTREKQEFNIIVGWLEYSGRRRVSEFDQYKVGYNFILHNLGRTIGPEWRGYPPSFQSDVENVSVHATMWTICISASYDKESV